MKKRLTDHITIQQKYSNYLTLNKERTFKS